MQEVKVGQVWQEDDPRKLRYVRVIEVFPAARVAVVKTCFVDGEFARGVRKSSAKLERFGQRKGYKFVREAGEKYAP